MIVGLVRLVLGAMALGAGLAAAGAETLRVGKGGPQTFAFAPIDIGLAQGIFQAHGLGATILDFDSAAKLHQAIAAGDIDMALASGPDMAFIAKGSPALTVAAMAGRPDLMTLVVGAGSPIRTVAGLKGKIVSVTSAGALTDWLARELSRQQGWGPDGMAIEALGAQAAQVAALRTHQTDAMVMDLTAAYRLEEAGEVRILATFGAIVPDFHMHVIDASTAILARDPDGVRRFLAAWFETIAFMAAHRARTVTLAAGVMGVSERLADRSYDVVMPILSRDGCFDAKALAVLRRSYVEMGVLPAAPDMARLYTERYLPGPCAR